LAGRTSSPRRAPQRSYAGRTAAERRAERRERLLAAGLELFGTDGYAATPIEKLCATAGVSTRNFYEEFDSREALLIALHDRVTRRAVDAVTTALASAGRFGARRRIELAVDAHITALTQDLRWTKIASIELIGVSRAVEEHRLRWRARWAELIGAEADRLIGRAGGGGTDYRLAALAVIGAVNELVLNWCATGGETPPRDMTAVIVRLIMGMLPPL
jgi:AcrR family transcriptional regulator